MVKLTVLYGRPGEVHEPLARTIPGLLRLEAGKVTTIDGAETFAAGGTTLLLTDLEVAIGEPG